MKTNRINTVTEKKIPEGPRLYSIYVCESLHRIYEDPKCPSEWRGSGCYDINEFAIRYHRILICAANRQQACDIAVALDDMYGEGTLKVMDTRFLSCTTTSDYCEGDVIETESVPINDLDWSRQRCRPSLSEAIEQLDMLKRNIFTRQSA